jgi:hypothetical protein
LRRFAGVGIGGWGHPRAGTFLARIGHAYKLVAINNSYFQLADMAKLIENNLVTRSLNLVFADPMYGTAMPVR